ncbi:hypothetical protein ACIPW4_17345 [Pseudomonas sp. NPDC089996]|uniref:hypothetical protein n=1 Tax=Pseudomonas sp. NPDC089996 TaxID=3364474 RepID=UPI0037FB729A
MDHDIESRFAKSFTGQLYAVATEKCVPLRLSSKKDKWGWGFTPEDDWLMAGGDRESIPLSFTFDSQTQDRLHYHINLAQQPHKKLGRSIGRYLGFYVRAQVTDYWKIEPLELTAGGLLCHMRDHEGNLVRALKDTPHFSGQTMYLLNASEGDVLVFLLQQSG